MGSIRKQYAIFGFPKVAAMEAALDRSQPTTSLSAAEGWK